MSNFRVGQKVVCISKGKMSCANLDALRYAKPQPKYGVVYTVRAINVWPDRTLLRFEEIDNSHMIPRFGKIEPGFNAKLFRPVVARKTSIEVFHRILDKVNEGVPA